MKRILRWWVILLVVILVGGGLVAWRSYQLNLQQSNTSNLQTVSVQKGSISQIVDATGNIRTSQSAQLTWQTSGTVASANVKVGDQVKAGDVLATLDMTTVSPNIITAQSALVADQQALANLQQSKTSQAQAQLNLINAQKNYTDTLTATNNVIYSANSQQVSTAQQAYDNAQLYVNQLRTNYLNTPDNTPDKAKAKFVLRMAIIKRDQALNTLNLDSGTPSAYDIQKADANLALAQAQLEDAQRAYELVANGPSQVDLAAAQAKVEADKATIASAEIVAPFSGTITDLSVNKGDVIKTGTQAFQIDDASVMYVDLQVSEVDVNKVQAGQPVSMTFDAIPIEIYNGQITDVSSIGTNNNGAVSYDATVKLVNSDSKVKSGMTASATITMQQKTNVLLVPTTAIQTLNTRSFVEVVSGNTTHLVRVQTGLQSDTMTEITSGGLNPGDAVVLNPTTTTLGTQQSSGLFGGIFRIFGGGNAGNRGTFTGGNGNFGGNRTGGSGGTGTNSGNWGNGGNRSAGGGG